MKKLKPMVYMPNRMNTILYREEIDGFICDIKSYGTHPCCYISASINDNVLFKYLSKLNDYMLDYILNVHGGITYSNIKKDLFIIGWDYAHYGDYVGYDINYSSLTKNSKKWTTEELYEELMECLNQIKNIMNGKQIVQINNEKLLFKNNKIVWKVKLTSKLKKVEK